MASKYRNEIIRKVVNEIDETNMHVCGRNWDVLGQVGANGVFATIFDWIVAVGSEWELPCDEQGNVLDEREEVMSDHVERLATEWLGLSQDEFDHLEYLPPGKCCEFLSSLLIETAAA